MSPGGTQQICCHQVVTKRRRRNRSEEVEADRSAQLDIQNLDRILSERIKQVIAKVVDDDQTRFIPKVVDDDQTGFIARRTIMDIVLSLQLCQDVTNLTDEPELFCKLDFEKALNRIQHEFMWETLEKNEIFTNFHRLNQPLMNLMRNAERTGELRGVIGIGESPYREDALYFTNCLLTTAE
ncbi:hypothetical protein R1sor_009084 [Riccia sorocarpa]|uniref:Uncharacterized protein n=1 Tax=Riccia sorocarpa TaxID=122646 RepID=A0ABD3H8A6_9MARC